MTAVTLLSTGPYRVVTAREDVFVAEMPRQRAASATPHTGHALLVAWLEPHGHAGERLARVRLPNGALITPAAAHVCPAEGLARRRILPTRPATPVAPVARILP